MPSHPPAGGAADDPLLDLAAQLVAERGADAFTMDELAVRAGLSRATVYRRFGSQRALLERLSAERGVDVAAREPDMRRRILDAARAVIGRVGPIRATVEQIAEQGGIGPATVYRHFGSKQGLIDAFRDTMAPRRIVTELVAHPGADVEGELTRFATEALRFMRDHGDLLRVALLGAETPEELAELRDRPNRTMHLLARYLEKQMRAGRIKEEDPRTLATALFGMLFMLGTLAPTFYGGPAVDPEAAARLITRLFLHGLAVTPAKTTKRRSVP